MLEGTGSNVWPESARISTKLGATVGVSHAAETNDQLRSRPSQSRLGQGGTSKFGSAPDPVTDPQQDLRSSGRSRSHIASRSPRQPPVASAEPNCGAEGDGAGMAMRNGAARAGGASSRVAATGAIPGGNRAAHGPARRAVVALWMPSRRSCVHTRQPPHERSSTVGWVWACLGACLIKASYGRRARRTPKRGSFELSPGTALTARTWTTLHCSGFDFGAGADLERHGHNRLQTACAARAMPVPPMSNLHPARAYARARARMSRACPHTATAPPGARRSQLERPPRPGVGKLKVATSTRARGNGNSAERRNLSPSAHILRRGPHTCRPKPYVWGCDRFMH